MKIKKLTRIFGVGLSFALLTSLMFGLVPASAGTLQLAMDTPPPAIIPQKAVLGSNVADMAVNGRTIYLVDRGLASQKVYKSTDGGASTWSDLTTTTYYPTGGNATIKLVAVAPDNDDVVAMVNTNNIVYYSDDGGTTWSNVGNPRTAANAVINAIDISPITGGYYYVAAGGTDATDAELYTIKMAMAESWTARTAGAFRSSEKIAAVKFSPNFDIDKIIGVVSANSTLNAGAWFQVFRHELGAYTWNGNITFFNATDWGTTSLTGGVPLAVSLANGGVGSVTAVNSASIAMAPGYLGSDEGERINFVSIAGASNEGGISRMADSYLTAVTQWNGGLVGAVHSLAYNDETLIAGANDDNSVFRCLEPLAVLPRCERLNAFKQPGGSSATVVAWSGSKVVAGTSGDDSAFAVSEDNGYAFNDVSFIDSGIYAIGTVTDMAVSADGEKLYVVSYLKYTALGDTVEDISVWLREGALTWSRVLSLKNQTNLNLQIHLAPDDESVVYLVCTDDGNIWTSTDSGKTRWKEADCYKLSTGIVDFAVESAEVAYAINGSSCTKTGNSGASWSTIQPLNVSTGYSLVVAPNGDILVGCTDGNWTRSVDGGTTFTKCLLGTGTSNVIILPDADYASNGIVYMTGLSSTSGWQIYRGTLTMGYLLYSYGPTLPDTDYRYYGLAEADGVVYALSSNVTETSIYRALNLKDAATSALAMWSSYDVSANCTSGPNGLKLSAGPRAWAINTGTGKYIYTVTDPIAAAAPAQIAPAEGLSVKVNPASGSAYDVTFTLERYSSKYVTELQLQIATDEEVAAIIFDQTLTGISKDQTSVVVGASGGSAYGATLAASFMPGTTYYWRVRVAEGGPALSPWSDVQSFTVEELEAAAPIEVTMPDGGAAVTAVSPSMGAFDVPLQPTIVWPAVEDATTYQVMVSEFADFSILEWSHTTDQNFYATDEAFAYATTYYWRARASEPEESAWVTGIFTTKEKPAEAVPPVVIQQPGETEIQIVEVPVKEAAIPNYLLWTIVGVGAVLVIALIVLIVRTRRVA